MKLTVRVWRDGEREQREIAAEEVSDVLRDEACIVWLDVQRADQDAVEVLRREFGFHELALEDVGHAHQRPKLDPFGGYAFLVAYDVEYQNRQITRAEVMAFVSKRYLVTVRNGDGPDLDPVVQRWEAHHELLREGGGYLLYILLDFVVDRYFVAIETMEDDVDDIEATLTAGDNHELLFRLRRQLSLFRRTVTPLRDVVDLLQQRTLEVVTEPLYAYYRDVYDHVLRCIDFVETLRDVLASALEVQLSIASNRLNEVMKSLTSWGAIILVPTLIAGIYGMNFSHMPELRWYYGYPMVLGMMLAVAFGLYRVFKRKGWL